MKSITLCLSCFVVPSSLYILSCTYCIIRCSKSYWYQSIPVLYPMSFCCFLFCRSCYSLAVCDADRFFIVLQSCFMLCWYFPLLFYPWHPSVWFFRLHTSRKFSGDVITPHHNDTSRNSLFLFSFPSFITFPFCASLVTLFVTVNFRFLICWFSLLFVNSFLGTVKKTDTVHTLEVCLMQ